jgi:hypothetical protein
MDVHSNDGRRFGDGRWTTMIRMMVKGENGKKDRWISDFGSGRFATWKEGGTFVGESLNLKVKVCIQKFEVTFLNRGTVERGTMIKCNGHKIKKKNLSFYFFARTGIASCK